MPLKLNIGAKLDNVNIILSFEDNDIVLGMSLNHKVFQIFRRLHGYKEFQDME